MRQTLLAAALAAALAAPVIAPPAAAQDKAAALTSEQWMQKIQFDRTGLVMRSLELTPAESKAFTPLYEKFQKELAPSRREQGRAILDFVNADGKLSDANAQRLATQVLAADREQARLHEKHFKELLKVLPARKAARYIQIENKLDAVVRYETAKAIPLVQ
jgi:Spy/CpxP family protein refolding chaperone